MDNLESLRTSPTPLPTPNHNRRSFIIGGMVVLLILAVCIYLLRLNNPKSDMDEQVASPSVSPSTTTESSGSAELLAGGNSYLDKKDIYTILYPNDFKMDTQNNGEHVRFYKQGPTQKGQTEMYDGVMMVIETFELKGQTMEEWLNERINQQTSSGQQIVQAPQKITIHNYPADKYRMRGLGEYDSYVLQHDDQSEFVILITTMVADPGNLGFQQDIDDILSTIRLIK